MIRCMVIWATDNWATHFGQLGDNIGRVIKDVNVGKILEIISFLTFNCCVESINCSACVFVAVARAV